MPADFVDNCDAGRVLNLYKVFKMIGMKVIVAAEETETVLGFELGECSGFFLFAD
jgi:hypothetical protein